MGASSNIKPRSTSFPLRVSWTLILCSTNFCFALQTTGISNHMVWDTSSGYTKPRACIQPINCNTIPQKDTAIPYMAQPRYLLYSHVLGVFFPFGTIPVTPHFPAFSDRYSPRYGRLSFSLYFITPTFFWLSFPHFHLVSQLHSWSNSMHATIPDLTDITLVVLSSFFPSHSSDLGYVGAQRVMFLGRFLV